MTPTFEFAALNRVVFGCGRVREIGSLVRPLGERCLMFTGGQPERNAAVIEVLEQAGVIVSVIPVHGEPTFDRVRSHVAAALVYGPDVIVAMGGGSVIDTAKAVAMLLAQGGDPMDYAEVIGRGLPITLPSVPWVAIPTTAGAGAEATRNAVLVEPNQQAKVSLRSHLMLPSLVMIDPELTVSLPPAVTAATGLDALSQLIEPYVSIKANPATDALCRAGIPLVARSLRRACEDPGDLAARSDLALAAWWSGMALANAGLGAVHGFAGALGGMTDAPHGLLCARFLVPVCRANVAALRAKPGGETAFFRYADVAALLTGKAGISIDDGLDWLAAWIESLPLPRLSAVPDRDAAITAALRSSSMKGNPVELERSILAEVFASVIAA
jgi:alcohol dehydrogenase class IV